MALTKKRRVFVEEYLRCFNATEAARRAGYKYPNKLGPRLVKVGVVADLIQQRIQEKAMAADEVLLRLGEQARAEHAEYIRADGSVDLERLLKDGKGHLVKGTKWDRQGNLVVDFYDAQSALVHIGKHHKMFTERHEVTGKDGGAIAVTHRAEDLTDDELARIAAGGSE